MLLCVSRLELLDAVQMIIWARVPPTSDAGCSFSGSKTSASLCTSSIDHGIRESQRTLCRGVIFNESLLGSTEGEALAVGICGPLGSFRPSLGVVLGKTGCLGFPLNASFMQHGILPIA